jgi:sulfur transfer protein SufE
MEWNVYNELVSGCDSDVWIVTAYRSKPSLLSPPYTGRASQATVFMVM